MPPILDDATLRHYLLGELSEGECEALEEEYFDDPEVLARVRGAEDDLIDDYVAGRLSRHERRSFERHHLATPGQRERLVAASALRMMAFDARAEPRGPGSRSWDAPRPRVGLRPALGALAALLLMSLVALRWWWPGTPDTQAPPPSVARGDSPAGTPSAPPPALAPEPQRAARVAFVIALAPLLTRAAGEPRAVRLPPRTSDVLLEFQGEPGSLQAGPRSRLRASLATVEGRQVWAGDAQVRASSASSASLASARLPASLLKPDDYIATLSSAGESDEPPLRYYLRVVE